MDRMLQPQGPLTRRLKDSLFAGFPLKSPRLRGQQVDYAKSVGNRSARMSGLSAPWVSTRGDVIVSDQVRPTIVTHRKARAGPKFLAVAYGQNK